MSEVPHIPDGIVAVQRTGNPGHLQTHAAQKILRCRRAGAPVKCNGLAQRHLSTIADSRTATSHGTRVRLTEEEHGRSASSLALFGVRVLVVEDGWQVADALKLSLEKMGMVVAGPVATRREAQRLATEMPSRSGDCRCQSQGRDGLCADGLAARSGYPGHRDLRVRRSSRLIGEVRSHPAQAVHRDRRY